MIGEFLRTMSVLVLNDVNFISRILKKLRLKLLRK